MSSGVRKKGDKVATRTIEQLTQKLIDYRGKTPQKTKSGIRLITAKVIKGGSIVEGNDEYIAESDYDDWMVRGLPLRGDVLITTEAPLGEVAQITTYEKIALAQRVILLRGKSDLIDQEYYMYALRSPFVQKQLRGFSTGTTVEGISQKNLRRIQIPYCELVEQKRIVDILTDRLSTIDKARAATEVQLKAAKALPAAYLRQVFDSPEAQKWEKKRLGDVCELVGGMQPPKSTFQYKPLPNYVRLVQIQDFRRSDLAVYIPQEEAKRQFNQTDVMIGRYGPPVFQILRGLSGAYNVALMKTVPTEDLLNDYLYYLLQEPGIQNAVINQSQRAAGQSGVQKEFLEQFKIFVPSIDKQQKIVGMLSDKFLAIKLLQQSLQSQLNTINKLPAALLRQAFNGEL